MQDNTIQCNLKKAIEFNSMQYHTLLCNYHTEPCNAMQYCAIPHMPCNTIQYPTLQYNTMQYHTITLNAIQYCICAL